MDDLLKDRYVLCHQNKGLYSYGIMVQCLGGHVWHAGNSWTHQGTQTPHTVPRQEPDQSATVPAA